MHTGVLQCLDGHEDVPHLDRLVLVDDDVPQASTSVAQDECGATNSLPIRQNARIVDFLCVGSGAARRKIKVADGRFRFGRDRRSSGDAAFEADSASLEIYADEPPRLRPGGHVRDRPTCEPRRTRTRFGGSDPDFS